MRAIALSALLAASAGAQACGYCVEDKVAATYDHAVAARALQRGHQVAFFHIDGPLVPGEATRRALETAAESVAGIDKGSVRVSIETLTLSFAFDPLRAPLVKAQGALERKLAARKLTLLPLRVMDRPAELRSVSRNQ